LFNLSLILASGLGKTRQDQACQAVHVHQNQVNSALIQLCSSIIERCSSDSEFLASRARVRPGSGQGQARIRSRLMSQTVKSNSNNKRLLKFCDIVFCKNFTVNLILFYQFHKLSYWWNNRSEFNHIHQINQNYITVVILTELHEQNMLKHISINYNYMKIIFLISKITSILELNISQSLLIFESDI